MKVVAFNGSARKNGNTAILVETVFQELKKEGIDCEIVHLAGKKIRGCIACNHCLTHKDKKCSITEDIVNECINKMIDADAIILASPTYFSNVTSEMKALIDRAGRVARGNNYLFKGKVGASIVAVKRTGAIHAFNSMNHFFLIEQMVVVGSTSWNIGIGGEIGDINKDTIGLETMKNLGKNMVWLLKKIHQ